jgi:hypothetical protein
VDPVADGPAAVPAGAAGAEVECEVARVRDLPRRLRHAGVQLGVAVEERDADRRAGRPAQHVGDEELQPGRRGRHPPAPRVPHLERGDDAFRQRFEQPALHRSRNANQCGARRASGCAFRRACGRARSPTRRARARGGSR